jgi:hypothetical protein
MSKERIQKEPDIEEIASIARETLLKDGSHIPTVIVVGTLGQGMAQLHGDLETSEDRAKVMWFLGKAFRTESKIGKLQKIFFIGEAWMSATARSGVNIRPSEDPKRVEVLVVTELDLNSSKTTMQLFEMVRDEHEELKSTRPYELEDAKGGLETRSNLLEAFLRGYYSESAKANGKHLH